MARRATTLQVFLRALKVALMNDDIPEIPPEELDMAIDEDNKNQGRGPEKRTAEQGIKDMQARIDYLTQQMENLSNPLNTGKTEMVMQLMKKYRADWEDAQQRLAEYQTQLKGKN